MKKTTFWISFFTLLLVSLVGALNCQGQETKLDQVLLHLNWHPSTTHYSIMPGFYKDFFKEAGIELKLQPGKGSMKSMKAVASGRFLFGYASAAAVLQAKTNQPNLPVKVVANLYPKNSVVVVWDKKKTQISSPADIKGKRVARFSKPGMKPLVFEVFLGANNMSVGDIQYVMKPKGQQVPAILVGEADLALGTLHRAPFNLKAKGINYGVMLLADHGVKLMDMSLIVNTNKAAENPDLVRRVVKAMMLSWQYANQHPEEAAQWLEQHFDGIDKGTEVERVKAGVEDLTWVPEIEGRPIGWMSDILWQEMQNTLLSVGKIKEKLPLSQFYDNRYLYQN